MDTQMKFNIGKILVRSPRLETVVMVENFIRENSGNFKKTELFNKLPRKVMWGTFSVIMEYLYTSNKIGLDKNGTIVWIYDPELYLKFANRKRY